MRRPDAAFVNQHQRCDNELDWGTADDGASGGAAIDAGASPRLQCIVEALLVRRAFLYSALRAAGPNRPAFVCKLSPMRYEVNRVCITLEAMAARRSNAAPRSRALTVPSNPPILFVYKTRILACQ